MFKAIIFVPVFFSKVQRFQFIPFCCANRRTWRNQLINWDWAGSDAYFSAIFFVFISPFILFLCFSVLVHKTKKLIQLLTFLKLVLYWPFVLKRLYYELPASLNSLVYNNLSSITITGCSVCSKQKEWFCCLYIDLDGWLARQYKLTPCVNLTLQYLTSTLYISRGVMVKVSTKIGCQ